MLAAVGCAAIALGCSDARKVVEAIAREEPAPLSRQADGRPGSGPDGRAKGPAQEPTHGAEPPDPAAAPEGAEDGADEGADGDGEDEAQPGRRRAAAAARGRRRRPAPGEAGEGVTARSALKVTRLVMARDVAGREPVGVATSFGEGETERLFAFVELTNETREPSGIVVALTPPGGGAAVRIPLDVGAGRRWRTWAMTRKARAPGAWSVAVSDAAGGAVLARTSFEITE